jgi:hypothetical protein
VKTRAPGAFPFRPWVRRACVKAALGGVLVVALVASLAAWVAPEGDFAWRRAVQVLAGYGVLFLASLAKIWWTARRPAVVLGRDALRWQPLHRFRPRQAPYANLLAVGQRAGTESLRLVVTDSRGGAARELFLNLGLVDGRNEMLAGLGERLRGCGLEPLASPHAYRRPGFADPGLGVGG